MCVQRRPRLAWTSTQSDQAVLLTTYRSIRCDITYKRAGPEVIKLFSCSSQLSVKFVLLINHKLRATANSVLLNVAEHENFSANKYENANWVGIFIFISRENFMLSRVDREKVFFFDLGTRIALMSGLLQYKDVHEAEYVMPSWSEQDRCYWRMVKRRTLLLTPYSVQFMVRIDSL